MKKTLKEIIKKAVGAETIDATRNWKRYIVWNLQGQPIPPHGFFKWKVLREVARQHGIRILIETGTAGGGTMKALRNNFDHLYSIELDPVLYEMGVKKIGHDPKITLLNGDSGVLLKDILKDMREPALFWLDAHYSGSGTAKGPLETPIIEELRTIFAHPIKKHAIVIDDMREFNGTHDYPPFETLTRFISEQAPEYTFSKRNDLLIIVSKG